MSRRERIGVDADSVLALAAVAVFLVARKALAAVY
jgi:hypothetical protein